MSVLSQSWIAKSVLFNLSRSCDLIPFIFPKIVLFDNGISLSFAAHWLSQTTSHISTAAGRIKYSAIVGDDLVRATLNANKCDCFNNYSFDRGDFVKPFFCLKYSLRFLSKKRLRLVSKLRMFTHQTWFHNIISQCFEIQ